MPNPAKRCPDCNEPLAYIAEDMEGGVPQYPAPLIPARWECPNDECGYAEDEEGDRISGTGRHKERTCR